MDIKQTSLSGLCCVRVATRLGSTQPLPQTPVSLRGIAHRLQEAGLEAEAWQADSLEDLLQALEAGVSIILLVDLGALRSDPRLAAADEGANHPVVVEQAELDDGRFGLAAIACWDPRADTVSRLDAAAVITCWLQPGGAIVTARQPSIAFDGRDRSRS